MKGIISITEHLFTILLLVIVIFAMVIIFTGYQATSFTLQKQKTETTHAFQFVTHVLYSPLIARDYGVFDDAKLLAALQNEDVFCTALAQQTGFEGYVTITAVGGDKKQCGRTFDTTCTTWTLCAQGTHNISYIVPVNIFRVPVTNDQGRMEFGVLQAGIYG